MPTESGLLTTEEKFAFHVTIFGGNRRTGGNAVKHVKTANMAIKAVHKELDDFESFVRRYANAEMKTLEEARSASNAAILALDANEEVEFRWVLDTYTGAALQVKIGRTQ